MKIATDHLDLAVLTTALRMNLLDMQRAEQDDPTTDGRRALDITRHRTHAMLARIAAIADDEQIEAAMHNELFRRTA